MEMKVKSRSDAWGELTRNGFAGRPSLRTWDVSYHYLTAPEGPLPSPFEPLNCALIFARKAA